MLKKAFNYASLGALALGWAGMTLWAWDLLQPHLTDDALAHKGGPAQYMAEQRANSVPVRPLLDSYNLSRLRVAPLTPPCPPAPASGGFLCDWIAFDERRMNEPENDYSPHAPQAQAHFEFTKNYTPDAAFRAWDEQRFRAAISAIVADPFISKTYLHVVEQADYTDTAHAVNQSDLKQLLLQKTADLIRAAYDLPPIPVVLMKLGRYSGINGSYQPTAPFILINYDIHQALTNSYAAMLGTLSHEVRHSIDADFAAQLMSGKMARTDVRAGHAAAMALNFKEYISHRDSRMVDSGHFFYDSYRLQYIERYAFEYGNALASRLIGELYCDTPARAHLCVLYKAQQHLLP